MKKIFLLSLMFGMAAFSATYGNNFYGGNISPLQLPQTWEQQYMQQQYQQAQFGQQQQYPQQAHQPTQQIAQQHQNSWQNNANVQVPQVQGAQQPQYQQQAQLTTQQQLIAQYNTAFDEYRRGYQKCVSIYNQLQSAQMHNGGNIAPQYQQQPKQTQQPQQAQVLAQQVAQQQLPKQQVAQQVVQQQAQVAQKQQIPLQIQFQPINNKYLIRNTRTCVRKMKELRSLDKVDDQEVLFSVYDVNLEKQIIKMLEKGVDPNYVDEKGISLSYLIVGTENHTIIRYFVKQYGKYLSENIFKPNLLEILEKNPDSLKRMNDYLQDDKYEIYDIYLLNILDDNFHDRMMSKFYDKTNNLIHAYKKSKYTKEDIERLENQCIAFLKLGCAEEKRLTAWSNAHVSGEVVMTCSMKLLDAFIELYPSYQSSLIKPYNVTIEGRRWYSDQPSVLERLLRCMWSSDCDVHRTPEEMYKFFCRVVNMLPYDVLVKMIKGEGEYRGVERFYDIVEEDYPYEKYKDEIDGKKGFTYVYMLWKIIRGMNEIIKDDTTNVSKTDDNQESDETSSEESDDSTGSDN